ncbi:enoyl-CoA hydratase/isomerase family protein [Rhodophyticola sp. CCM32]|uniref:enoyl-CoA hydratase/isomerase family protein n=1 Tax=Rhodophyticola sp. CCM32 TaxID=2916397 RepID=UPI00107EFF7E|nr:enoyl-CoA hydratase-related protein [Rhodophyticola sp. CCM32]QBY01336.1 enoyl-CoA hydratase/isomerase family protein [Rhodophyticola sp. CCM32]
MSETRLHPNLVLTRKGAIHELRVDREEALGALNFEIMEALGAYITELSADTECRALILTGTGKGFVAGADITGYHGASQAVFDAFQRRSRQTFDAIAVLPQITICAVNGYALGGGFELALCCDFILVAECAKLGLPEIKLGLLPGGGGTQRLPKLVGRMRAKEILLSGRFITASEAVDYGAALEVLEADALLPRARDMAEMLVAQAPVALSEGKRVIDDGVEMPLSAGLTFEQRVLGALYATDDAKEGIDAFVGKRDPVWSGT